MVSEGSYYTEYWSNGSGVKCFKDMSHFFSLLDYIIE